MRVSPCAAENAEEFAINSSIHVFHHRMTEWQCFLFYVPYRTALIATIDYITSTDCSVHECLAE